MAHPGRGFQGVPEYETKGVSIAKHVFAWLLVIAFFALIALA